MKREIGLCVLALALVAGTAHAGTTTIDFTQGLGNLVQLGGSGSLSVDSNCDAVFTGTPTYLIGNGSSGVITSGTVSITMNIVPATDVGVSDEPGLTLIDDNDGSFVTATVDSTGLVTLTNGSTTDTMQFGAPAAAGTSMTLTYNPNTDTTTLTQSGSFSDNATIPNSFPLQIDTPAVKVGVVSFGGGKFESLSATGTGIPNLDSTGVCGGSEGEGEGGGGTEGEVDPIVTISGGGYIVAGEDDLVLSLNGADGAVGYQWRKNGADLSGETGATLVRAPVLEADEGNYRCAVDFGAKQVVLSNIVTVTVFGPNELPAMGGSGLVLLGAALAGAMLARSRKR
ncbi:MAG: hypothetical protein GC168_07535 [Candidatus Hydrogenedens sp.]|nr:hypothetical protein [Candidatus Hydrogenedens sp.]